MYFRCGVILHFSDDNGKKKVPQLLWTSADNKLMNSVSRRTRSYQSDVTKKHYDVSPRRGYKRNRNVA